ncbi:hypothetical protein IP76_18805 [Rhizobium sp. AAP43]|nr:hypothetical protein IP76_18805 [Rhizobium sp. AAP43]
MRLRLSIIFPACSVLVALGYLQQLSELSGGGQSPRLGYFFLVAATAGAVAIAPLVPFVLATVFSCTALRLPRLLAVVLAIFVGLYGLILTMGGAIFAGGGATMVLLHGATLTLAVSASVLLIARHGPGTVFRRLSFTLFMIPTCAAMWSLATVPIAVWRSNSIALGEPMCVAEHHDGSYSPVSWSSQRAFSLYTTRTGYKNADAWYFHRILQVKRTSGFEVFNWSFATMNFEPIMAPERYLVKIVGVCVPRKDFWSSVAVL